MAKKKAKKAAKKKAASANAPALSQRRITITGKFSGQVNNHVVLDVFRANSLPSPYNFSREYNTDFTEVLGDLEPGLVYAIDFTGFTTTRFDLEISGDMTPAAAVKDSFTNTDFSPWYSIKTN